MNIAVIGTGNVGKVLARRWKDVGYSVILGSHQPDSEKAQVVSRELGIAIVPMAEAASTQDIVLLAVPGRVVMDVAGKLGDLTGKILVDCSNSIGPGRMPDPANSMAQRLAARFPGARVVKAFNTTGAKNMANPVYEQGRLMMPLCGDDEQAKGIVAELANVLGFAPFDNGALSHAFALEGMAYMWINQAYSEGWGPDFGFAVFKR